MIKQIINVDNYWRVIVYYNIDITLFPYIRKDIYNSSLPVEDIDYVFTQLAINAKAATVNIPDKRTSIVLLPYHKTNKDYINSIIHEAEHVKEFMLEYYKVSNSGEPPAYTIGYLVAEMYDVFKRFITR